LKKLYTEERWKKYCRQRQRSEEKRGKRRKEYNKRRRQELAGLSRQRRLARKARRRYTTVLAPRSFSFIDNTEEMVSFLGKFRDAQRKKNVFIDLSGVATLSADAIPVLLSEIAKFQTTPIRGNAPEDPKLAAVLGESGFYDYVHASQPPPKRGRGRIRRRESHVVDGSIAKELIAFATSTLYGAPRRWHGVYRTLLECMSNTIDHASPVGTQRETWWVMTFCEAGQSKADFTFVDTGVGIFQSVKMDLLKRALRAFGVTDNTSILREILHGEMQSRTGVPYRGKGLPGVYKVLERGVLSRLVIVANDVYADVSKDDFRILDKPFKGTFLYWEVAEDLNGKDISERSERIH